MVRVGSLVVGMDKSVDLLPNLFNVIVVAKVALERSCVDIPVRIDAGAFDEPPSFACKKHLVAVLGFDAVESPSRPIFIGAASLPRVYRNPSV